MLIMEMTFIGLILKRDKAFIEHVLLLKRSNMEIHLGWKTSTRRQPSRRI